MRFIKDILLIDLETSGPDPERDVVVQFASILLDKDNLLEKSHFSSYIKNSLLEDNLTNHAKSAHTSLEVLRSGLKPVDFIRELEKQASTKPTLAVPNIAKLLYLRQTFKKQNTAFAFDNQILDLWTLEYISGAKKGLNKIPSPHTLMETYGLRLQNPYSAIERVKAHAHILRKICNNF